MHELSIATAIVDLACEEAAARSVRVRAVYLKLGVFSGVVKEALSGSFEIAAAGTPIEGSRLVIEEVPLVVYCTKCATRREPTSTQLLECPECGEPAGEVLEGRELQVTALEVEDYAG